MARPFGAATTTSSTVPAHARRVPPGDRPPRRRMQELQRPPRAGDRRLTFRNDSSAWLRGRRIAGRGPMKQWVLRPSVIAFVLLGALALVGGRLVAMAVDDQEQRLLKERANEVSLVLQASINSLSEGLGAIGAAVQATDGSQTAFRRAADLSLAE